MKIKHRNPQKPFIFAIIGGGLTGTSMLCQFVGGIGSVLSQGKGLPSSIEIHVIEKNQVFGPGFPHSDQNAMPFHLINMCARDMSILSSAPDDFQIWVDRHITDLEKQFSSEQALFHTEKNPDPPCQHYPRPVMGEYLKARFREAVRLAEDMGVTVRLYPGHEVTDLREEKDNRVRIVLKHMLSGKEVVLSANRALLATGHWSAKDLQPGYFPSPWPAAYLQDQIPKGTRVAIIGSSLSAIDAVLTLTADGTFRRTASGELVYHAADEPRKLILYSRNALLPTVRGRAGTYKNRFLTRESIQRIIRQNGELTLEDLFVLLDRDLERAYGCSFPWHAVADPKITPEERLKANIHSARKGHGQKGVILWQTVLQQVFPMVREWYLTLSPNERMRFNKDYSTLFFSHAAPMPMINAEKLLALIKSGIVTLRKAVSSPKFDEKELVFTVTFQDLDERIQKENHDYVVDARGQSCDFRNNPQPLAENLLNSGTVETEPYGLKAAALDPVTRRGQHSKAPPDPGSTGSVWIDPKTHRIQRTGPDGELIISEAIYAIGAMTRGQIIDASMAHGSAVSTETVALDWINQILSENPSKPPGPGN